MRSRAAALMVGSLVALSACGTQPADIAAVSFHADSPDVQVVVGTCNQDPEVLVLEAEEIRLSASVRPRLSAPGADACQDVVTVQLHEPVGSRVVVDDRTGLGIPVNGAQIQVDPAGPLDQ